MYGWLFTIHFTGEIFHLDSSRAKTRKNQNGPLWSFLLLVFSSGQQQL
jgi:hypothetical protein